MPLLTRVAIRIALIYLIVGAAAGALYWINSLFALWPPLTYLNPVYIHMLVVGWITQLIFAVIYWMFPIISKSNLRGNNRLAWAALVTLNLGLALRVVCEPWRAVEANGLNQAGLLASALLQIVAGGLIVLVSWPRVREKPGR